MNRFGLALVVACVAMLALGAGAAHAGGPMLSFSVRIEGPISEIVPQADGSEIWRIVSTDVTDVVVRTTTEIRPVGYQVVAGRDYVTIEAFATGAFQVEASYITVQTDEDAAALNELEFRGMISQAPSNLGVSALRRSETWTIAGRNVDLDGKATVIGEPEVGSYAHVKGRLLRTGVIRASHVEVYAVASASGKFEVKGAIQVMAQESPGEWVIDGVRGIVTEETEIEGDPAIGAIAEAKGKRQRDGSVLFQQIRVETAQEVVRLEGIIEVLVIEDELPREGYLTIEGQTVYVDGMTFIDESRARAARGMWADVVAHWEGRLLFAQRIRVERPD